MPASRPLAGVRVLDLTRFLPGPVATQHLADLGADIIKIEDRGQGDPARYMDMSEKTCSTDSGDAALFQLVNRNKRSVSVDLKQSEGVSVLLRLAQNADLLVEGFRPGVMDRLGVGYEAVRAVNPSIVYCSINAFGASGPEQYLAGHDINFMAASGVLDQIGQAGGPPVIPNIQIGDLLGGALTPLVGMLAALYAVKAGGSGTHVEVAMTEAVMAHAVVSMAALNEGKDEGGASVRGAGLLSGGRPEYAVYETSDGRYLAVGALEDKFWQRFCEVLSLPHWAQCRPKTAKELSACRDEVVQKIKTRTLAHWESHFSKVDCCVTPVKTLSEALASLQSQSRGLVRASGEMEYVASPWLFDGVRAGLANVPSAELAPKHGAHTQAVLREAGYRDEELARLLERGVI